MPSVDIYPLGGLLFSLSAKAAHCLAVCETLVYKCLPDCLSAWYNANTPNAGSVCAAQVAWQHVEVERTR